MKRLRFFYTALMFAVAGADAAAQAMPTQPGTASAAAAGESVSSTHRQVAPRDTLWNISRELVPGDAVTRQQVMLAVLRKNPDAFVDGSVFKMRVGSQLALPTRGEIKAEDAALADEFFNSQQLAGASRRHPVPVLPELRGAGSGTGETDVVRLPDRPANDAVGDPAPPAVSAPVPPASVATPPAQVQESASARTGSEPGLPSGQTEAAALSGTNLLWPVLLGVLGVLGVGGSFYVLRRRAPQQKGLGALKGASDGGRAHGGALQAVARPIMEQGATFELVRRDGAEEERSKARPNVVDLEVAAACLELGRPDQARRHLQRIVATGEGLVRERAQAMLSRLAGPA